MHVVGHQHIGMDQAAILGRGVAKPVAIPCIILLAKENRRAVIAALDHVQRLIAKKIASKPRHRRSHQLSAELYKGTALKSTLTPIPPDPFKSTLTPIPQFPADPNSLLTPIPCNST